MASSSSPPDVSSFEPTSGQCTTSRVRLYQTLSATQNQKQRSTHHLRVADEVEKDNYFTDFRGQFWAEARTRVIRLPETSTTLFSHRLVYRDGHLVDPSTIQHCAVDDATNTVLLTVQLLKDAAEVPGLKSLEETSPPKPEWPPNGHNMRIVSIDTESCVAPKDITPLRGYKCAQYMSELGGAFIDIDTDCAHHHDRALDKKLGRSFSAFIIIVGYVLWSCYPMSARACNTCSAPDLIEHLDKKALVAKMSKVQLFLFLTLYAPTHLPLCQSRSTEPSSRDPSARRPLQPQGPEELILHGETHDPEPTYQYYFRKSGYVMEFIEDPTTQTFVAFRSWAPVKFQVMSLGQRQRQPYLWP
ncbi:hypothetical protein D6C77_10782 [Aureobasidium pullulans]|nr:hypothetical protein D6C77_10782 [Aureobasidium pullulans]